MDILAIDVETTGIIPGKHSLIEVAAIYIPEKGSTKWYNFLQPPNKAVNLGALKYNNYRITNFLDMNNVQPKTNFGGFIDFLLDIPKESILLGHNVNFDIDFLKAECENYNIESLWEILPKHKQDTKVIANFLIQCGMLQAPNTTLTGLAEALKIKYDHTKLHRADYDIELTVEVYKVLKNLISSYANG